MGLGRRRSLICSFMILTILSSSKHLVSVNGQGLSPGYYAQTCPLLETIVVRTIYNRYGSLRAPIALLRLQFSDCFVEGCDGSVFVVGSDTEQTASFNANLHGFEIIDDIKAQIEQVCPGVVSCADILALATREAITMASGPRWEVKLGRRDGRISLRENVRNLSSFDVPALLDLFASFGFTTEEFVALTGGGHTMGTTSCKYVGNGSCPAGESSRVVLDRGSEYRFDTSIFRNIINNRGVLKTDQDLSSNPNTSALLPEFLSKSKFYTVFARAMVKMSEIGVKTGVNGEIRNRCYAIDE